MMMQCAQTVENFAANGAKMSVMERQKARQRWQQMDDQGCGQEDVVMQHPCNQNFMNEGHLNLLTLHQFPSPFSEGNSGSAPATVSEFSARPVKYDPVVDNGWPDFTNAFMPSAFVAGPGTPAESYAVISRTSSCPPLVGNAASEAPGDHENAARPTLPKAPSPSKKRKTATNTGVIAVEEYKHKKVKREIDHEAEAEAETEVTQGENSPKGEASLDTSKDNSKISEVQQKPDYIHVRARRGQATDSHSLAERVRREKISERMRYLQDLVPGCNKITGKAGMLDEIINYVQSLQKQVEFLSMKLAAVNPRLDFHIDNFFAKEMFPASSNPYPTLSMLPDLTNQALLQYNPQQQVFTCGGPNNMTMNPPETAIRGTTSEPVSVQDGFIDTCFHGQPSSSTTWEIDLQTLYNTELHQRQSAFSSQQYQGNLELNNLKMEI